MKEGKKMLENVESKMKEIASLERQLTRIETTDTVIEYKRLMKALGEKNTELNYIIENTEIDKITDWIPSRKGKSDEYWEGQVGIVRTKKTTRKIISEIFVKQFPFLAGKLAKFTLKDVEPEITKEELESVIVKEDAISYKAQMRTEIPEQKEEPPTKTVKTPKKKPAAKKKVKVTQVVG